MQTEAFWAKKNIWDQCVTSYLRSVYNNSQRTVFVVLPSYTLFLPHFFLSFLLLPLVFCQYYLSWLYHICIFCSKGMKPGGYLKAHPTQTPRWLRRSHVKLSMSNDSARRKKKRKIIIPETATHLAILLCVSVLFHVLSYFVIRDLMVGTGTVSCLLNHFLPSSPNCS